MGNTYECPICGEKFQDIDKYAVHFTACNDKRKAEEEKRKSERLAKEREKRKAEVDAAYEQYKNLQLAYDKDYPKIFDSSISHSSFADIMNYLIENAVF